jgi:hypothetical protein
VNERSIDDARSQYVNTGVSVGAVCSFWLLALEGLLFYLLTRPRVEAWLLCLILIVDVKRIEAL